MALQELLKRPATTSARRKHANLQALQHERLSWLRKHGCHVPTPKLPGYMMAELLDCFKLMDADGSGAIDMREISAAFATLGITFKRHHIKQLLDEWDPQNSGEIGFEAFASLVSHAVNGGSQHQGQISFTDAIRAYRRKKLLMSVQEGGEAREQVMHFYIQSQQLIKDEVAQLRKRVKAHEELVRQLAQRAALVRASSMSQPGMVSARRRSKIMNRLQKIVDLTVSRRQSCAGIVFDDVRGLEGDASPSATGYVIKGTARETDSGGALTAKSVQAATRSWGAAARAADVSGSSLLKGSLQVGSPRTSAPGTRMDVTNSRPESPPRISRIFWGETTASQGQQRAAGDDVEDSDADEQMSDQLDQDNPGIDAVWAAGLTEKQLVETVEAANVPLRLNLRGEVVVTWDALSPLQAHKTHLLENRVNKQLPGAHRRSSDSGYSSNDSGSETSLTDYAPHTVAYKVGKRVETYFTNMEVALCAQEAKQLAERRLACINSPPCPPNPDPFISIFTQTRSRLDCHRSSPPPSRPASRAKPELNANYPSPYSQPTSGTNVDDDTHEADIMSPHAVDVTVESQAHELVDQQVPVGTGETDSFLVTVPVAASPSTFGGLFAANKMKQNSNESVRQAVKLAMEMKAARSSNVPDPAAAWHVSPQPRDGPERPGGTENDLQAAGGSNPGNKGLLEGFHLKPPLQPSASRPRDAQGAAHYLPIRSASPPLQHPRMHLGQPAPRMWATSLRAETHLIPSYAPQQHPSRRPHTSQGLQGTDFADGLISRLSGEPPTQANKAQSGRFWKSAADRPGVSAGGGRYHVQYSRAPTMATVQIAQTIEAFHLKSQPLKQQGGAFKPSSPVAAAMHRYLRKTSEF